MTLHEAVMAEGEASQTNSLRWERPHDALDIDPSDGTCTFCTLATTSRKARKTTDAHRAYRLPGC